MVRLNLFLFILCFGLSSIFFSAKTQELPFIQYTVQDGLGSMFIRCMYQDSRGILWVGTLDGISKFNGEGFKNYNIKDGLDNTIINTIAEDKMGNLWLGCGGSTKNEVYKFDGIKFSKVSLISRIERIYQIRSDSSQDLFFNALTCLLKYNSSEDCQELIDFPIPNAYCHWIIINRHSNELIALLDRNIYAYNIANNKWHQISIPIDSSFEYLTYDMQKQSILAVSQNATFQIQDSEVCLMSNDYTKLVDKSGSRYVQKKNGLFMIEDNQTTIINSEPNASVYIDQENNIWTYSISGLKRTINSIFRTYPSEIKNVWQPFLMNTDSLFLLSYEEEPMIYSNHTLNSFRNVMNKSHISGSYYHGISVKSKDTIYFCGTTGLQAFYPPDNLELISNQIPMISYYDPELDWILVGSCPGVQIYDCKNHMLIENIQALHTHYCIVSIVKDNNGFFWFGSYKGLSRFNPITKDLKNYTRENKDIPFLGVISMNVDSKNTLWLGTTSGLYRYISKVDSFEKISGELINSHISFIQSCNDTLLVLGSTDGIYSFNLKLFYQKGKADFNYYNQLNGYQGDEPRQNGSYMTPEGKLYIGSNTKLSVMDLTHINWDPKPVKLFVSKVNNRFIKLTENSDTFYLENDENFLNISFDLICQIANTDRQVSFFLEGQDLDWKPWQNELNVQYQNLSKGKYNLNVLLKDISGDHRGRLIKSIVIVVNYPFYKERNFGFYLALCILFVGLLFSLLWYNNLLRFKTIEMERSSWENKYLKNQMLQSQLNPHFIFNVLTSIQNLISKEDTINANKHIFNLSRLMRRFLDSSIKSNITSNMGEDHLILLSNEIELIKMYIEFEQLQYKDKFDYKVIIDDSIDVEDIKIPPMIIQPFIENSIKHGLLNKDQKGQLIVEFKLQNEDELVVEITDNGIGRSRAEHMAKLSIKPYKSYGTKLVASRIELLKTLGDEIDIHIEDLISGGTFVKITFLI